MVPPVVQAQDDSLSPLYDAVYVARQPIFDQKRKVFGYELLYRDGMLSQGANVCPSNADTASIQVASSGVMAAVQEGAGGKKMFINFTSRCILEKIALALPSDLVVVEVLEDVELTDDVQAALWDIKKEGYTIAVDDYIGQGDRQSLLEFADIVKVDVLNMPEGDIPELVSELHSRSCILLAEKVDSHEAFDKFKQLGFDLFQGYFFAKPENLGQRQLRSGEMARIKVLEKLQDPQTDLFELANSIKDDVSLSYRLLRYIQSTSFSLPVEIKSIRQAALLLGTNKLKNWLRLLLLSDLSQGAAKGELPYLSLSRATFFEHLAEGHSHLRLPSGEAYLLGLFSFLEAMMEAPMSTIAPHLMLSKRLKQALVEGEHSIETQLLHMVERIERGDWDDSDQISAELGLEIPDVMQAYHLAQTSASELFDISG